MSSVTIADMPHNKDVALIIAKNLRYFMKLPAKNTTVPRFRSARALGIKAGVSPNTVSNYLKPKQRTVTLDKPEGFPVLDKLAKLASELECDVWELLHPDIEKERREKAMYQEIIASFHKMTEKPITETTDIKARP